MRTTRRRKGAHAQDDGFPAQEDPSKTAPGTRRSEPGKEGGEARTTDGEGGLTASRHRRTLGPLGLRAYLRRACAPPLPHEEHMPRIDIDKLPIDLSTGYPPPFSKAVEGRARKRLGRAAGLTQFGVNICTLEPGAASSQRHWHEQEDELVYVLEGEVVLCEDGAETVLKPGDAAAWKAGVPNGHCLVNRSNRDAVIMEIGTRAPAERAHYSDIDMMVVRDERGGRYMKKNGTPY